MLVSHLLDNGACLKAGVRIGDHIVKINGEKPQDEKHAVKLCDAAWTAEADGTDKNKDRLKFSLHRRTQDYAIGREGSGLVAGTIHVEVLGGTSSRTQSLLGGEKNKLESTGLTLEDSPAGYGALITDGTQASWLRGRSLVDRGGALTRLRAAPQCCRRCLVT